MKTTMKPKPKTVHRRVSFERMEISVFARPGDHNAILSLDHFGDGPCLRVSTHLTQAQLRETAAMLADVVKALDEEEGK